MRENVAVRKYLHIYNLYGLLEVEGHFIHTQMYYYSDLAGVANPHQASF